MENQVFSSEEDFDDCVSTASQSPSYNEDVLGGFHANEFYQNENNKKVVKFTTLYIKNTINNTTTNKININQQNNNINNNNKQNISTNNQSKDCLVLSSKTNSEIAQHFMNFLNKISENKIIYKYDELTVELSEIQENLFDYFQQNSRINNTDYLSICFEGEFNNEYLDIIDMGNMNGKTMCEGKIYNINENLTKITSNNEIDVKSIYDIEKMLHLIEIYGKLSNNQIIDLVKPYEQIIQQQQQNNIIVTELLNFEL